jgi:hypothetical protein
VRDRQTGPQRRTMAAVEPKQCVRRVVIQATHRAPAQVLAGPGDSQSFALETEEREFIQRVAGAEPIVEFEAIDDADRISEPDVLRTQIAVSVDDVPAQHAFDQKIATLRQEAALH